MRPTQRRVLSAVTLLLLTALGGRSAGAQTTVRVSVASDGTEGNDVSLGSALSADGRFVAFDSAATDLVAGDTNGVSDVFVHDRQTGTTERVSVASDGAQGNGSSGLVTFAFPPALSADGRFVAFVSFATNLVASDTNGATDVFVHDRQTGTTERVSVASDGTEGNAASAGATLAADGRFVAFHIAATNLVAGDTNGTTYVVVHDRQTATTERASANGFSAGPALSADGRFVAFHSTATNLVAGDTNGATDVFVHDRQTGTTERVSGASDGTQGNDASAGPALSADGRLVAFHSSATNLVAGDANRAYDVFVHDRAVSTTTTSTTQPATTSTVTTAPPTTATTASTTTVTTAPTTTVTTASTTTVTTAPTTTVTTASTTTVTTASTTTVTTAPPTTVTTASTTTVTTAPTTTLTTASTTTVTTAPTTTLTTASTTTVTTASTTTVTMASTTTVTTASTTTVTTA